MSGSKGIALVDTSGEKPSLRYVFDVADTGGGDNARRPYLWQLQDEHMDTMLRALEARYGVSGGDGLEYQLELVADRLVKDYWADHQRDILGIIEDSFLEEYDDYNVGASFRLHQHHLHADGSLRAGPGAVFRARGLPERL